MEIIIESRKKKIENVKKAYPGAEIIDVTSKGTTPFVRFSPFYPIGEIPVPFSDGTYSASVEGIWQGLKVFVKQDVDLDKFKVVNMKGLKRTVRSFGVPKGHRKGVAGTELLDYITARKQIYIPTYRWVLANKLNKELDILQEIVARQPLILLDYEPMVTLKIPQNPYLTPI